MPTTYDELTAMTPLRLMAQNRDLVSNMPDIIRRAENLVYYTLDHDAFKASIGGKTVGDGVATDDSVIDLSAETRQVYEIRAVLSPRITDGSEQVTWMPLIRRNLEYLLTVYSRNPYGNPIYYAEYDDPLVIKVFPAPQHEIELKITANQEPPRLGSAQQTNLLTQRHPGLIEAACLLRAAEWQKNKPDIDKFSAEYLTQVELSNSQVGRRRRDETETKPITTANVTGQ